MATPSSMPRSPCKPRISMRPILGASWTCFKAVKRCSDKTSSSKRCRNVIDEALAMFSDTQHQTLKEQGEQNVVERQLQALCQTAVNENSSDVHVLTTPDSTLFYCAQWAFAASSVVSITIKAHRTNRVRWAWH